MKRSKKGLKRNKKGMSIGNLILLCTGLVLLFFAMSVISPLMKFFTDAMAAMVSTGEITEDADVLMMAMDAWNDDDGMIYLAEGASKYHKVNIDETNDMTGEFGGGLSIADFNENGLPELVFSFVVPAWGSTDWDDDWGTADRISYTILWDCTLSGGELSCYAPWDANDYKREEEFIRVQLEQQGMPIGAFGWKNEGFGMTFAYLDGNDKIDALVATAYDQYDAKNEFWYMIGWDCDAADGHRSINCDWTDKDGNARTGLRPLDNDGNEKYLSEGQGGDVVVADFDNDGFQDVLMMTIADADGQNWIQALLMMECDPSRDHDKLSCDRRTNVFTLLKGAKMGENHQGLGAAVLDLDGNGRQELLLVFVNDPGGENKFRYALGRNCVIKDKLQGGVFEKYLECTWGKVNEISVKLNNNQRGAGAVFFEAPITGYTVCHSEPGAGCALLYTDSGKAKPCWKRIRDNEPEKMNIVCLDATTTFIESDRGGNGGDATCQGLAATPHCAFGFGYWNTLETCNNGDNINFVCTSKDTDTLQGNGRTGVHICSNNHPVGEWECMISMTDAGKAKKCFSKTEADDWVVCTKATVLK